MLLSDEKFGIVETESPLLDAEAAEVLAWQLTGDMEVQTEHVYGHDVGNDGNNEVDDACSSAYQMDAVDVPIEHVGSEE